MITENYDNEFSGASPVLLALTGNNVELLGARRKKPLWKKAFHAIPAVAAARATVAALKKRRAENIRKSQVQKAERARKLADARRRQIEAETALRNARTADEKAAAEEMKIQSIQQYESIESLPQGEITTEEISDIPETPADETETIEEGVEDQAEVMSGYSRSNDDYFIGATKPVPRGLPVSKGQLQIVKTPGTSKKFMVIFGGVAIAAYIFRKQIKKALKG